MGFTVVELLIVIVVLGIFSAYAVMRSSSVAEVTLPSQAQKMASDLRHVQTLASSWGQRLRVTAGVNSYSVSCSNAVAAPCPLTTLLPITDPSTGNSFFVTLQKGVVFVTPTTAVLDIDSMGQPLSAASYTLSAGSVESIVVSPLTGLVTVTP